MFISVLLIMITAPAGDTKVLSLEHPLLTEPLRKNEDIFNKYTVNSIDNIIKQMLRITDSFYH